MGRVQSFILSADDKVDKFVTLTRLTCSTVLPLRVIENVDDLSEIRRYGTVATVARR